MKGISTQACRKYPWGWAAGEAKTGSDEGDLRHALRELLLKELLQRKEVIPAGGLGHHRDRGVTETEMSQTISPSFAKALTLHGGFSM